MIESTVENKKAVATQLASNAANLAKKGNFEDAIKHYREAIKLDPKQPVRVYQELAHQLIWHGYTEEAVTFLDDAIKSFPDQPGLYTALGACYSKIGDTYNAISNYEKAFELNRNQPLWVYLIYAGLLTKTERFDQSLIVLNELVNSYPDSADGFALLGLNLAKIGNFKKAISANTKAVELASEKNKSHCYLQLAQVFFEQNQKSEAEIKILEAIKFITDDNFKTITNKLISHIPLMLLLKILLEVINSSDSSLQKKAIKILASRSLAYRIRSMCWTDKQSVYHIKNQIQNQLLNIVNISSSLDTEKSLELFILLSFLGYESLKDYYLNSLSQFIPRLSLPDFAVVYCSLTSTDWGMAKLSKEIIKPTNILKIVTQSLTNQESTEETAVIYSMLCFVLGQEEEEVLVLEKFLKDKKINLKDSDSSIKGQINYRESLRIALDFRLKNNDNSQEIDQLFCSRISPNKNYIKLIQSNPKVAVCISGQLRGYKQAYPSIKKFIVEKLNADVFVHTWEDIGYREPIPVYAARVFSGNFLKAYQKSLTEYISFNEMKQSFPTLLRKLSSQGKADLNSLKQFFSTDHVVLENDNESKFQGWKNLKKYYYKIYKCSQLRESYSKNYDLVITIRPDMPIIHDRSIDWHEICQTCNSKNPTIYSNLNTHLQTGGVILGDACTISNPDLSFYELTFPTETLFNQKGLLGHGLLGHFSPGNRAWMTNTQVRKIELKFGGFKNYTLTNEEIFECLNVDIQQRQVTKVDEILLNAIQLDLESDKKTLNSY